MLGEILKIWMVHTAHSNKMLFKTKGFNSISAVLEIKKKFKSEFSLVLPKQLDITYF